MVQAFPEVLRHETESAEQGPAKVVKAGVAVVGVGPYVGHAHVSLLYIAPVAATVEKITSRIEATSFYTFFACSLSLSLCMCVRVCVWLCACVCEDV